jgi:UDPglucose 6-dehydrogenase
MENTARETRNVEFGASAYDVARDADALLLVTEWNEFKNLDLEAIRDSMRRPVLVDGRNLYDLRELQELGFVAVSVARGTAAPEAVLVEEHVALSD